LRKLESGKIFDALAATAKKLPVLSIVLRKMWEWDLSGFHGSDREGTAASLFISCRRGMCREERNETGLADNRAVRRKARTVPGMGERGAGVCEGRASQRPLPKIPPANATPTA